MKNFTKFNLNFRGKEVEVEFGFRIGVDMEEITLE